MSNATSARTTSTAATLTVAERTDRADAAAAAARNRADRTMGGLTQLLAQRPELRGVHAPADLADETIRWSA